MDKMKGQDVQLTQASGVTTSTDGDWITIGTTPTTNGSTSQGTASQGANRPSWQGLLTRVEPFIPTVMHKPTSTCIIGSSLIHVHQLISFVIYSFVHSMHQVNMTLSLATNAGVMITNLKAQLSGYGTVWFDPQATTNVLSCGNIAKQYPIRYLQESDTFQVQLSNCINIFGHEQVDNLYVLEGNQPRVGSPKPPSAQETFPKYR